MPFSDKPDGSKSSPPLYQSKVSAGFPSPAQDYVDRALDLNELCITHPNATFFVKVDGDSMTEAAILDGDVLVVNRSIEAVHGDIVIAAIGADFTVKELCTKPSLMLLPRNAKYSPITFGEEDELKIFGVVTSVVRVMRK
jgi:DNA polymerase V